MPTGSRRAALTLALFALTSRSLLAANRPEREVAREIARTGAVYYDDGAWELARDHFHRAYQLVPAPTLALMEARALVRLGRLVEALTVYDLAAKHPVDPGNDTFRRAAADAQAELDELRSRVPRLRITSPAERGLQVRLNGAVLSDDALQVPLPLDPGTHLLELQRNGESKTWTTVALREGDQRAVRLELPPADQTRAVAAFERHRVALWSALAVGGAGVLVGVGAGAIARHQQTPSEAPCADASCPAAADANDASSDAWRTVSISGYALGLAGLATGGVLLATLPHARPHVTALFSPAGPTLAVAGSF